MASSRMARYAYFSIAHGAIVLGALSGVMGSSAALVVLVVSLPLFFAWGLYQADVAMNPELDETSRSRWRMALWILPWSMALYWHWYVSPRETA